MGTITTELMADEQTRDRRGRRITAPARRAELLRAYEASGLTRAAFARQEGLKYSTFAGWVQGRKAVPVPSARAGGKPKRTNGPVRFTELRLAPARRELEVALPGGLLARGPDAAELAALVHALLTAP